MMSGGLVRSASIFWRIADGRRAALAISLVFMALGMGAAFLLPQCVRVAVDCVVGGEPLPSDLPMSIFGDVIELRAASPLMTCAVVMMVSALLGAIFDFAYRRISASSAEEIIRSLRDRLCSHILSLPCEWHSSIQTGDIIQRCTSDVEALRLFYESHLPETVRAALLVGMAYTILFSMDAEAAAVSFAWLAAVFLYSMIFLKRASERFRLCDEAEGRLLATAQENFTGARVVRAFCAEARESKKFAAQSDEFADLWIRLGSMLSSFWGISDLLTGLQMVSICAIGALRASEGELSAGSFIVFLSYSAMIIWPVRGLGRSLSEAGKAAVSASRIMEILDARGELDQIGSCDMPAECGIELKGVTFYHGDKKVLDDVSFRIPHGGTLGIVGAAGSGKSTIAMLLCRLYDLAPGCGSITVGGIEIERISRRSLRSRVGIVMQQPFLFSETLAMNIASLSPSVPRSEIEAAVETACLGPDVRGLPDGLETQIGERGVTLSGGQKQRTAIARAILRRPSVMLLDDALSAVDTRTEASIISALRSSLRGVTTVIISHRASALSCADWIVALDGGRAVEQGRPEDLASSGGIYARMLDLQGGSEGGGDG